jgi:hypothetical protein
VNRGNVETPTATVTVPGQDCPARAGVNWAVTSVVGSYAVVASQDMVCDMSGGWQLTWSDATGTPESFSAFSTTRATLTWVAVVPYTGLVGPEQAAATAMQSTDAVSKTEGWLRGGRVTIRRSCLLLEGLTAGVRRSEPPAGAI